MSSDENRLGEGFQARGDFDRSCRSSGPLSHEAKLSRPLPAAVREQHPDVVDAAGGRDPRLVVAAREDAQHRNVAWAARRRRSHACRARARTRPCARAAGRRGPCPATPDRPCSRRRRGRWRGRGSSSSLRRFALARAARRRPRRPSPPRSRRCTGAARRVGERLQLLEEAASDVLFGQAVEELLHRARVGGARRPDADLPPVAQAHVALLADGVGAAAAELLARADESRARWPRRAAPRGRPGARSRSA